MCQTERALDKLIKKNLRQKSKKNEAEMMKKFMEESQRKLRMKELSQRNKEIKIANASKVGMPVDDLGRFQSMLKEMKEKKRRSKSCMQRPNTIFSGPQSTKATQGDQFSNGLQGILKQQKDRDKSHETLNNKRSIVGGTMEKLK